MKYFRTGLVSILFITLVVSPVMATSGHVRGDNPPFFPACEGKHSNGDHAHYDYGWHAVPGYSSLIEGSDDVYSLGSGNYLQCLCPIDGRGIQTNWWKVDTLSWDAIMHWTTKGWKYEWGSGWNLDNEKYLAKNSVYNCHEDHDHDHDHDDHRTPTPTQLPTSTPTPTPTEDPQVEVTPTPTNTHEQVTPTPTPSTTEEDPNDDVTPTPTTTPTNVPAVGGSVQSAVVSSDPESKQCSDVVLAAPTITSVKRINSTTVEVTWTAVQEAQYYVLAYGIESGQYIYGIPNTGNVNAVQVGSLDPHADYYFQVRAQRGCMPGDPSNELSTKPLAIGGLPDTSGNSAITWMMVTMMGIGGWLIRGTYEL